jgi:hypothetical protein
VHDLRCLFGRSRFVGGSRGNAAYERPVGRLHLKLTQTLKLLQRRGVSGQHREGV